MLDKDKTRPESGWLGGSSIQHQVSSI